MEFASLVPENFEAISEWLKFFSILGPLVIIGIVIMILFQNDFSRLKGNETKRRLDKGFDEEDDDIPGMANKIFQV